MGSIPTAATFTIMTDGTDAQRTLTLSSYSIVGMMSNPEMLFDDIVSAVKRGVQVRLFVRQRNAFSGQRGEDLHG